MDSGVLTIPIATILLLAAARAARLWPSWPSRLTAVGVISFGLVVVAFQALGVLAAAFRAPLVTPVGLLISSAVVAGLCWGLARRAEPALGCPGKAASDSSPDGRRSPGGHRRPLTIVAGVAAVIFANAANLGLSAPPRGWDVLTYHMPKALAWLQHGNLGNYGAIATFYPGNGELAILFSLFTGTDRLASLVQLPFGLLGAVALYGLARELGARKLSAAASSVVFLAAPIVLFQSAIAKDDLIVTGLVVAGVYMLLRSLRGRHGRRFSLLELATSGFAFGLAVGVKYSVIPIAALAVAATYLTRLRVARSWRGVAPGVAAGSAWRRTALFVAAAAVPSLFWFVQNWAVAGNPLEPLSFGMVAAAFGRHDPTYVSNAAGWLVFPWIDRAILGSYSGSAGFGAAFAAVALPAFGFLAWLCAPVRARRRFRLARVTLLTFAVGCLAAWWLGGHHLPRFLLPCMALACAPAALLLDRLGRPFRTAVVAILVVAAAFSTAESLRVIYSENSLVYSHKGFVGKAEHYHMPDLIYEVPPGTRILLLDIPGIDVFNTYRYPASGDLPGNEVFMMGDIGFETDLVTYGPVLGHESLLRDGVDYIFVRTLAVAPGPTIFDRFPDLYELVLDEIDRPYQWYRKGYVTLPGEDRDVRAPALTKVYRVLAGSSPPPN